MGIADQFLQDAAQPKMGRSSVADQFAADSQITTKPTASGAAIDLRSMPDTQLHALAISSAPGSQAARDEESRRGMNWATDNIGNMVYGAAKGAADLVQAPAQLAAHGVNSLIQWLPSVGPIKNLQTSSNNAINSIDDYLKRQEEQYQADTKGYTGAGVGRVAAGVAPFLLSAGATGAPQASSVVAATGIAPKVLGAAKTAGQGAAYGVLTQPATNVTQNPDGSNSFYADKTKQAIAGSLSALAGKAIGNVAAKVINPETSADAKLLLDEGVNLTPGQILGGGFKRVEDGSTSVPVLGDMVKNAQRRALNDFNTAALNRSGVNVAEGGQEGLAEARKYFNTQYNNVLGQMSHSPDQQFERDVIAAAQNNQVSPEGMQDILATIKQQYVPKFQNGPNGALMSGNDIKAFDRQLRINSESFSRSQDPMDQRLGQAYGDIRDAFNDSLKRQNQGGLADALNDLDSQFASFAQYRNAATSATALKRDGIVTPSEYMAAVARGAKRSGRLNDLAQGDALNQDLASAANNVLGNTVPDSGTPFRHAIQAGGAALLGHSVLPPQAAAMVPLLGTGVLAASAPYTTLGQKIAAALLAKRPDVAAPIADAVRTGAPFVGAGVSPLLLQALKDQSN